jgi:quercetin dioxygenase-like cupin family protein
MSSQAQAFLDPDSIPWIPLGPGESFKPLRFLAHEGGRVLLLRLEPGRLVPKHRHLGEVHAFNLAGSRLLIETGQVVGPGGYVYEPAGNVDSWKAVGDAPVVVQIVAYGAMEYLDERGEVLQRDTPSSLLDAYLRYCRDNGLVPAELGGAASGRLGLAGAGSTSLTSRSAS